MNRCPAAWRPHTRGDCDRRVCQRPHGPVTASRGLPARRTGESGPPFGVPARRAVPRAAGPRRAGGSWLPTGPTAWTALAGPPAPPEVPRGLPAPGPDRPPAGPTGPQTRRTAAQATGALGRASTQAGRRTLQQPFGAALGESGAHRLLVLVRGSRAVHRCGRSDGRGRGAAAPIPNAQRGPSRSWEGPRCTGGQISCARSARRSTRRAAHRWSSAGRRRPAAPATDTRTRAPDP